MSNTAANTTNETIANEKENTMVKGIPFITTKTGRTYYDRNTDLNRHAAIREELVGALDDIEPVEVLTCIPGETWANFTDDVAEVNVLGRVMALLGWTSVCTVAKAGKYCGTPNPDYEGHGWLVKYRPHTYKTGKKAGMTETTLTVVYPVEAFVWNTESGEPEFDEKKAAVAAARKAKTAAKNANKALREANAAAGIKTPRRKSAKKPAAPKVETIKPEPIPAAAPVTLIHIKLPNGVEFDAHDAKEAAELKALLG